MDTEHGHGIDYRMKMTDALIEDKKGKNTEHLIKYEFKGCLIIHESMSPNLALEIKL